MSNRPIDMAKIAQVVRAFDAPRVTGEIKEKTTPKSAPIDASLRKTVRKVNKGCSGFQHPHFHI